MNIHGYTIEGDEVGLRYLAANASALQKLIDEVRASGSAAFLNGDRRYVVLPTTSSTFMVSESHNRSSKGMLGTIRRRL